MTVTIPTSEAQYGYVVGRVIRALGDTTDPDDKPDAVAATGKVTFTPKSQLGRTSDYSAFIVREKIDAPLDAQGNLVRYEGATPAGIALTVGAYRVEFTLNSGSIPGFDIEVTAGHTQAAPLDLVTAAPYVPPTGVTVNTMLVPAGAVVGQVLAWSASGLDWVDMAAAAGGVSSVAGRTGTVVLSSADLTDAASLATDTELASGLAGKANTSHTHAPADITGTAVITTDPRLSDARTPTTHTHPASAISDSTATGRSVLTAADAAAARTAIGAGTSNLAIGTTGTTAAAGNRQATETAIGMVELATTAEATTGTDKARAVTPAGVKAVADTKAASTHTHTLDQTTDTATRVAMTPAERTKLTGVATGATTNATDAQLRDRNTHTGAQPASTISDLTEATQDVVGAMVVGAGGTYDDGARTITLPSGGGGGAPGVGAIYAPSGRWYTGLLGNSGFLLSGTQGDDQQARAHLVYTPVDISINALGVEITSGAAGALIDIGLYAADGAGRTPGTRIASTGSIGCASGGEKSATFASTSVPAGMYWMVVQHNGVAVAARTRDPSNFFDVGGRDSPMSAPGSFQIVLDRTWAELPASLSGTWSPSGSNSGGHQYVPFGTLWRIA